MSIQPRFILLALVLACVAPSPVMAEGPPVVNIIVFDVGADLPGFLGQMERGRSINERLQTQGTARVFQSTLAGPSVGNVVIAVEYPSMQAMAAANALQSGDAEWQQYVRDVVSNYKVVSNSLSIDVTPAAN